MLLKQNATYVTLDGPLLAAYANLNMNTTNSGTQHKTRPTLAYGQKQTRCVKFGYRKYSVAAY